eukprot:12350024-Ditylum_brightwellii.AAC.1
MRMQSTIFDEHDNGNDNTDTAGHNNDADANETSDCNFHNKELPDSAANNTNLPPEEPSEVEKNKHANKHNSVGNKVNTNVPVMQYNTKD